MAKHSNFIVRGGANFSSLYKELNKSQKKLSTFQAAVSKSLKAVGAIIGSLAIGKLIKDSTKMAMSVETAMDNLKRNMGNSAKAFQDWANTQSQSLGMAKSDAYKYGSTFSNLLSSFQKDTKETADSTQELMKATAIISSKTGRTYEDTAERIRSGMLGSTEAIEDLGVYTNVSMMESTEAFKKFANGRSWAQLDFQTQQQIRLAAILEQTYKRYGETLADTTATRQNQFVASLKNIQLSLGQAFLPIYNAVLPALTKMADALGSVINRIAQFTQALFGKPNTGTAATQNTRQQTAAVAGLGDATAKTGNQAEKAGKQAKNSLANFDELNVLSQSSGTGAGAGGAAGAGTVDMPAVGGEIGEGVTVSEDIKNAMSSLNKMLEPLKAISFDNLASAFDRLKKSIEPITKALFAGLEWAYLNLLVPLAKWTIEDALPAFIDALAGAFNVLNAVIVALQPLGTWLWEKFLQPIAKWTGGIIVKALESIAKALNKLADWISNNQEIVQGLTVVAGGFLLIKTAVAAVGVAVTKFSVLFKAAMAIIHSPVLLVVAAVTLLAVAIADLWKNSEEFRDKVKGIAEQISTIVKNVWGTVIKPVLDALMQAIDWLWTNHLKPLVSNIFRLVQDLIQAAASIINDFVLPIINAFVEKFGPSIARVFQTVINILASFLATATDVINGVVTVLRGIIEFLTGVFTGNWKKAWEGIVNVFKGAFEAVGGIVKGVVNVVIDMVNNMISSITNGLNFVIRALNKIHFNVPEWVPGIGGKSWGVNIPTFAGYTIPKLATGAVIPPNNEFLAVLGDQKAGTNIETPERLLRQVVREELSGMAGNGDVTIRNNIELDGEPIFKNIKKIAWEEFSRSGESPFPVFEG